MPKGLEPLVPQSPGDLTQSPHWGANVPELSNAPTPGRVTPDIAFTREFFNDKLTFSNGQELEYWAFKAPGEDKPFPSTIIRCRQGQIVHSKLVSKKNVHTIHHHGIEPSTFNDGVGHTSFHVGNEYTYQFRPAFAGTYFYHCHRNTVLHFQMGMFGFLVVDPPTGPGTLFAPGSGPSTYPYQAEALWAIYDIDPAYRDSEHDKGEVLVHGSALNVFEPRFFTINGVDDPQSARSPKTTVRGRVGQSILIRLLSAAYFPTRTTFPPGLQATIVGTDGRALVRPVPIGPAGITMGTSERYDILLKPTQRGTFRPVVEFRHWLRGNLVGSVRPTVIVT